jgi:hypothetical protein
VPVPSHQAATDRQNGRSLKKPEKEREDRSKGREGERIQEIFTVDFRLERRQERVAAYVFG